MPLIPLVRECGLPSIPCESESPPRVSYPVSFPCTIIDCISCAASSIPYLSGLRIQMSNNDQEGEVNTIDIVKQNVHILPFPTFSRACGSLSAFATTPSISPLVSPPQDLHPQTSSWPSPPARLEVSNSASCSNKGPNAWAGSESGRSIMVSLSVSAGVENSKFFCASVLEETARMNEGGQSIHAMVEADE